MPGQISFFHDTDADLIVVRHRWNIETFADILVWQDQYETYLATFGRKMDVIVVIDDLYISADIGRAWSDARARTYRKYIRWNCRVRNDGRLNLFIETIAARYPDLTTSKAPSVEAAVKIIKEWRRRSPENELRRQG